jgi:hypothetical protein
MDQDGKKYGIGIRDKHSPLKPKMFQDECPLPYLTAVFTLHPLGVDL